MSAQLCSQTLDWLPENVTTPHYDRSMVQPGVVHFGVGSFHRAHQAVYCDDLLQSGDLRWGIKGVSMRSPRTRDALKPQDFLYTLAVLSDRADYRVIGSILDILVGPEQPDDIAEAVAAVETKLITVTITEKGYCLAGGEIDETHTDLLADLASIRSPVSVYGFLAAGLILRRKAGSPPITIVSCDNIHGAAEQLRDGTRKLLAVHDAGSLAWMEGNVAFASSMVDRVTPATSESFVRETTKAISLSDRWPVATEPFSQWVIADNFLGDRPGFDEVGAQFTHELGQYEQMKLGIFNASHSIVGILGFLSDDEFVHDAMARPWVEECVSGALTSDILPVTRMPTDVDSDEYIKQTLARFRNASLPYSIDQLCADSSKKIQQRWLPSIKKHSERGSLPRYLLFTLAAWAVFVERAFIGNRIADVDAVNLRDAARSSADAKLLAILTSIDIDYWGLTKRTDVMAYVEACHRRISETSVREAAQEILPIGGQNA